MELHEPDPYFYDYEEAKYALMTEAMKSVFAKLNR